VREQTQSVSSHIGQQINFVRYDMRRKASQLRQSGVASSVRNQVVLTSGCSGQLSSGLLHQHRLPFVVDSLLDH